ncbi:hypothetical protein [Aquabacterium sp. OR-4]|uniref:hypothetical protein n=1 Tax=Aquabacterium sp. OR-4 TaxID=2978127 RepID=UPI0021B1B34E|nr:hypothetical protein [Aquabacterium sp. OR-4]MDT7836738.1 hypothetical protein [Aquabacterium sp. OR-4]
MNTRLLLGGLALASYGLLSYALMLHAADAPWTVAALFGPLLLPPLAVAWRQRRLLLALLGLAAAAGLVLIVAAGGLGDVRRLYLLQHVAIHLVLGAGFALTLMPGRTPLITAMAGRLHAMTPAKSRYTRGLTWLWLGYFAGMAVLSLAVFALGSWAAWSLLANVLTPVCIATVFGLEYLLRYRLHPEFERVRLADVVRAWRSTDATR